MPCLLIGGGPGMDPEYLLPMIQEIKGFGEIWAFSPPLPLTEEAVLDTWTLGLTQAVDKLKAPVIVGHSFGGMLALQAGIRAPACKGLILISTFPDSGWQKHTSEAVKRADPAMWAEAEQAWNELGDNSALARLFAAWSPFYFTEPNVAKGGQWLSQLSYSAATYRFGPRFFEKYRPKLDLESTPTLAVTGEHDQITPITGFQGPEFSLLKKFYLREIAETGHFPWFERPESVRVALQAFVDLLAPPSFRGSYD